MSNAIEARIDLRGSQHYDGQDIGLNHRLQKVSIGNAQTNVSTSSQSSGLGK
jgi:hypothetical protein